ncbi:hypothetical protein [Roseinatronobacter monicus]|uniref:Type IV secretion system protein VirB7 n=1 Tax=Roseinatronobacter monicus TaxID=393481 RepID=A0A543K4Y5_9RHOB|nr:hypothetical protein [Roseinatronobacter monicus]TQM90137.1 hypothetical protein BD293_4062 [Roseinatronobacter monicus]
MKAAVFLLILASVLAGCASTPSAPVRSECFRADGTARCKFTPLPELWAREAARDA